ncbi:MAG: ABC transporter ATP-binding protein [Candidatus Heimdallarchaeaceae archaeon]
MVKALDGVTVSIHRGEIVSIVGPSGSGKTTLLNLIGALDYLDSGTITVDGQELSKLSDKELSFVRRETIGYVFQNFNLLEELNAEKNIEMPLILSKKPKEERKKRVEELLSAVGLLERRNHKPDQLSGGEQQRVAIARALANDPEIILADEPTGNLDSSTGERILDLLIDLSKEHKKTLIYVTHSNKQAILAQRQLVMNDGTIIKDLSEE